VVLGVGCDAVLRLDTSPLRHFFWIEVWLGMLVVVDVGVCCKPKGECGFVAILWRSYQLNIITRTSVAGSQKKNVIHRKRVLLHPCKHAKFDYVTPSSTERLKWTRWVVCFGPFGWPSGHPNSGLRPRARLGRTRTQRIFE
jgi:hypothetical protein